MHFSTIDKVWHEVIGVQPPPPGSVVLGAAVLALLGVLVRDAWRILRNVVTVAHEGGHALVALLVGRKLKGIRLHHDTSGVTLSKGRSSGPGMVATAMAGYLTPSLLGLAYTVLLAFGHITAVLWLSVVLLVAMLTLVRNAYGVGSILVTAAVIFGVSWFTSAHIQAAFAYAFTFFLIVASIRPLFELQGSRRRGRARDSDVDQLASLTGWPAGMWITLFGAVSLVVLVLAGRWLIPFASFGPSLTALH